MRLLTMPFSGAKESWTGSSFRKEKHRKQIQCKLRHGWDQIVLVLLVLVAQPGLGHCFSSNY